jgi:signal transduction histidine kinase
MKQSRNKAMPRVRGLLKRQRLPLGVLAVSASLLAIVGVQYRSLVTLKTALPVYHRELMRNTLRQMTEEIEAAYRQRTEAALNVPAAAIGKRVNGVIPVQGDWLAPRGAEHIRSAVARVAEHFGQVEARGVRRFFLAVMVRMGEDVYARVAFVYDPLTRQMKSADGSPEFLAIHGSAAPLMPQIRAGKPIQPQLLSNSHGEHRIFTRQIVDEAQHMVAVAGLVADQDWLRQEYLPQALHAALPKYLPAEAQQALLTLADAQGQTLFATQANAAAQAEVQIPLSFINPGWRLGLRLRQVTEEQWARRNFYLTLALWLLMSGTLAGGLWLALRAASREVKLSQMKSDFVSNVSHELRTPLASIRVFGEFLKLGLPEDARTVRQYGEYIESESRRLTGLINNILDFSRIESEQKSYSFELADVNELVSETLKTFELLLKHSEFELRLEAAAPPLPHLLVDTDALTQAFVNLLDNAVKYSGAAREIVVTLARNHLWATIAVSDRGIGIPDDEQAKIFERFHRVSRGLVHDVKGTGLGLAIVKHIVEAHHGRITVASRAGHGSTFTIFLPLEESKVEL